MKGVEGKRVRGMSADTGREEIQEIK